MDTKVRKKATGVEYDLIQVEVTEAIAFSINFAMGEAVADGLITQETMHVIAKRADVLLGAMLTGKALELDPGSKHYNIVSKDEVQIGDDDDNLVIGGE
jgi:hypothetical protein